VWRCTNGKILKVAWRNEKLMSESEIYDLVGADRGVARLKDGGDDGLRIQHCRQT
jgi:hypothetical protein